VIKRGQRLSSVLEEMREKGVIRYPTLLKALMKISGVERSIKPGKYRFFKGQGEIGVLLSLREGPQVSYFRLTIKEGENLRDIAKNLRMFLWIHRGFYPFPRIAPLYQSWRKWDLIF